MLKFLLQTVDGRVRHDFVFEMEHAIDYQNWRNPNSMGVEYMSIEQLDEQVGLDEYIPVGTIEFVHKFIDTQIKQDGSKEIRPINVPKELFPYAGRTINNFVLDSKMSRYDVYERLEKNNFIWIKSNERIKDMSNGHIKPSDVTDEEKIPTGEYQISEDIDIVSEYRCFIYKDELVGIQYYSGDFTCFPDMDRINDMLDTYYYDFGQGSAPQSFTLDVAVTKEGETVVIEVHEFYSCGLYGFSDYNVLPYMFARTFNDIKKRLIRHEITK